MTLTDILPSLRTMQPDPLDIDAWPERTVATTTDVVVSAVSLVRLADLCETPCTHSGSAVLPRTYGRPSQTETSTTVVARVTRIKRHPSQRLLIEIDADLTAVSAVLSETRLIGRVSTTHDLDSFLIIPATARRREAPFVRLTSGLPADLREGDLLALPCAGMVTLHDIRCGAEYEAPAQ